MRTRSGVCDSGTHIEFGALFHRGGQHIITCGISLIFKVRENFALKRLGRIQWNHAVE